LNGGPHLSRFPIPWRRRGAGALPTSPFVSWLTLGWPLAPSSDTGCPLDSGACSLTLHLDVMALGCSKLSSDGGAPTSLAFLLRSLCRLGELSYLAYSVVILDTRYCVLLHFLSTPYSLQSTCYGVGHRDLSDGRWTWPTKCHI